MKYVIINILTKYEEEKIMTRSEVKRLEYDCPMPKELNGKWKVHEEVFISSGGEFNEEDAKAKLETVRKRYTEESGWHCEGGIHEGIFEEKGRWYTYRHQAKYE
jgi:hypothetical protein